jgi:CRP/FNR family transcriptional regulator, dissimilatory nitrate respiration regulator
MVQKDIFSEEITPCNHQCSFCFLNYTDVLADNYLFRNLDKMEIGRIIKEIHHRVKEYNKGDIIAQEGDYYDQLIILIKGSVVGEMMDFSGRVLRVEKLQAPESPASNFIFGDNNTLPVTITAEEDTRIILIPREELIKLFAKNETVLKNYLTIMANRAQFLSKKVRLLGLNSLKAKLAFFLLEQRKKQDSDTFNLPITQNDMADILGTTRPSVGRALRELHYSGYIEAKGKNIRVLDKEGLSLLLG